MGVFLRQLYKEKPLVWGSLEDRQYAIRENSWNIYGCNPDDAIVVTPMFWGLPCIDYSGKLNHGINYGTQNKDGGLEFNGTSNFYKILNDDSFTSAIGTVMIRIKTPDPGLSSRSLVRKDGQYYICTVDRILKFYDWSGTTLYSTGENIGDNNLHQAVLTYNSGVANESKAYYDGSLAVTGTSTITSYASDLRLGVHSGEAAYWYAGDFFELYISKTIHTAEQVALFHERPWDLYRPVGRTFYSFSESVSKVPIIMQMMDQFEGGSYK